MMKHERTERLLHYVNFTEERCGLIIEHHIQFVWHVWFIIKVSFLFFSFLFFVFFVFLGGVVISAFQFLKFDCVCQNHDRCCHFSLIMRRLKMMIGMLQVAKMIQILKLLKLSLMKSMYKVRYPIFCFWRNSRGSHSTVTSNLCYHNSPYG